MLFNDVGVATGADHEGEPDMQRNVKRLAISASLIAGIAASAMSAMPAHGVPAAANPGKVLAMVGSDTSFFVADAMAPQYNLNSTFNTESPRDLLVNVAPLFTAPFPTGAVVPADADCAEVIYKAGSPSPNGSSAGISALVADATGCLDIARSSRNKTGSDPASLEFYAFGLDAVSWVKFPGTKAPLNLTQQNLQDIYICDSITHAPLVTDWSQVGGTAGTIKRYYPQSGSGTFSFWNTKIMGQSSSFDPNVNCDPQYDVTYTQEHDATTIAPADKPFAITPFAYGQWTAASKGVLADRRNGGVLGNINGVKPGASTINETPTRFLGTRYLFHVLKNTGPTYNDAMRAVGVDNAGNGWLCNNSASKTLKLFGVNPLKKAAAGSGVTTLSYCRLNPTSL